MSNILPFARIPGDLDNCGRCGHPYAHHKRPERWPDGAMPCRDCDCPDLRP